MNEKQTYAEEIIKKLKESKDEESKNIYNIENDIDDGYIIVKYKKLELEEKEIIDGSMLMVLPKEFKIMDKELAEAKYPGEDKPDYIYTNEETTVNITFSIEEGEIVDEEVEEIKQVIEKQMQRLYPASKIEDSETIKNGEKSISYFSFDVPALDGDLYNLMFFMAIESGLVMGNFNSNVYQKKEWCPIIKQMLMSIKENKKQLSEEEM